MKKNAFCSLLGFVGGAVSNAFGGWNAALSILLLFMGADYVTGLIVAGVFHKSTKSESGTLESRAGWKGLLRKVVTLMIVPVANGVDILMGTSFLRDAVTIAFATNEALSILENAALMGVPVPDVILKSLDVLKKTRNRPKKRTKTDDMAFRFFNPNPAGLDVDDCAVRALCRITGRPWTAAHKDLCDISRDICDMPVSDRAFGAALHALGFARRVLPDLCPDCYTVARFAADNPFGAFILATPGHVVAVVNGDWYDTHDCAAQNVIFVWAKERT